MKALSIRQPWAWLIVNGYKDVENRTWSSKFFGQILVHAGAQMTRDEYGGCLRFAQSILGNDFQLPEFSALERGGVVGTCYIYPSATIARSKWFTGPHGLFINMAQPLPFMKAKGALGFFDLDIHQLQKKEQEENAAFSLKISDARKSIVAHSKGKRGVHGSLSCPICSEGVLKYSVSGYNGHIHAGCSTPGCVRWIE